MLTADRYFVSLRLRDLKNRFLPASVTLVPSVNKFLSFVQPERWASPASVIYVRHRLSSCRPVRAESDEKLVITSSPRANRPQPLAHSSYRLNHYPSWIVSEEGLTVYALSVVMLWRPDGCRCSTG